MKGMCVIYNSHHRPLEGNNGGHDKSKSNIIHMSDWKWICSGPSSSGRSASVNWLTNAVAELMMYLAALGGSETIQSQPVHKYPLSITSRYLWTNPPSKTIRINESDNDFKLIIYGQHLVTRHRFLFCLFVASQKSQLHRREWSILDDVLRRRPNDVMPFCNIGIADERARDKQDQQRWVPWHQSFGWLGWGEGW